MKLLTLKILILLQVCSIDTIRIKLNNLTEHSSLAYSLFKESKFNKTIVTKEFTGINLNTIPVSFYYDVIKYADTGNEILLANRSKLQVPSSSYYVVYDVDLRRDNIWFEFSVPKVLYGNNVAQFVVNPQHPKYQSYNYTLEYQKNLLYERTMMFIEWFFKSMFLDEHINKKCVEISRVDLCYNLYFQSKEEALQYLSLLRKKRKKFTRDDSPSQGSDGTGIWHHSKLYYAKIYHKGTEYFKNDFKEHQKHNDELTTKLRKLEMKQKRKEGDYTNEMKELRKKFIDTNEIQRQADLILRYELEFKPRFMSYIYKNTLFRKKCPEWKNTLNQYKRIHSKMQVIRKTHESLGRKLFALKKKEYEDPYLKPKIRDIEKQIIDLPKISKSDRELHKEVRKVLDRVHQFYLKVSPDVVRYSEMSPQGKDIDNKEALFSRGLMNAMCDRFIGFINDYTISELPPIEQTMLKVKAYNENVSFKKSLYSKDKKILTQSEQDKFQLIEKRDKKFRLFLHLLDTNSMDQIKQLGVYSDRTFYRMKSELKHISGIDNNMMKNLEGMQIQPDVSYKRYYENNTANGALFFGGNIHI